MQTHANAPVRGEWISAAAPAARTDRDAIRFTATGGAVDVEAAAGEGPAKPRKFSMVAYTGGPMNVGAYYNPVVVDLSGLDVGNSARPILIDHESDLEHVLGQTDKVEVKGGKLVVSGNVFGESDTAKQVISLNDKGFKFQASIGARVTNREFVPEGSTARVNGLTVNGPINIARKSVLGEVSFVVLGADDNTSASIAASSAAERKSLMDFQQWLAAMGLSADGLTDEQKTKLQAKYDAEQKAPPADTVKASGGNDTVKAGAGPDDVDDDPAAKAQAEIRARRAGEVKRLGGLELLAAKYKDDFEPTKILELHEAAITAGHSVDKFELELLRARKPKAPHAPAGIIVAGDRGLNDGMIEAAFCTAAGLENVEKRFDDKTLEAAHKRFGRSVSLQQVLIEAAWANGCPVRNFKSDPRAVLRYAFNPDVQAAGFSNINVSGILANTANKFLLEGFMHVEQTWSRIASTRPVSDFKQITSYRMTGSGQYEKVPASGEIKHGQLDQESFTNQADTYGLILTISRKDLINDDLGAFTSVPRRLGRGAGLKLNDVFWTAFLDNSAFFTTGRNNYFTGAATNLQSSSLKTAVQYFRRQVDADNKPLGVDPKILLTAPEDESTADELYTSTNINTGGSSTTDKVPNRNTHAGKYKPEVSAYLSNSSYTGYSTTGWYLLADPADLSVVEVAFLNGQQSPTIETADADFNTLGIQMRGYHDFGVSKQDYRAGVKSKGAA